MITDCGKYYLYRHIRLDKNEVFYIGIGTKSSKVSKCYSRAKSKSRKNKIWHNIVAKTPIKIEILLESNDIEFIKNKEIEFIRLYGRRDLKKGSLVNLTNGGDSGGFIYTKEQIEANRQRNLGRKHNEQAKRKVSEYWAERRSRGIKGKPLTSEQKIKLSSSLKERFRKFGMPENSKKTQFKKGYKSMSSLLVLDLETGIYYDSIMDAARSKNITKKAIYNRLTGKVKNNTSFILV